MYFTNIIYKSWNPSQTLHEKLIFFLAKSHLVGSPPLITLIHWKFINGIYDKKNSINLCTYLIDSESPNAIMVNYIMYI